MPLLGAQNKQITTEERKQIIINYVSVRDFEVSTLNPLFVNTLFTTILTPSQVSFPVGII